MWGELLQCGWPFKESRKCYSYELYYTVTSVGVLFGLRREGLARETMLLGDHCNTITVDLLVLVMIQIGQKKHNSQAHNGATTLNRLL